MDTVYMFASQVQETNEGTEVVIGFLQGLYPSDTFTNVEQEEEYQKIDVDFIWSHNKKDYLLEIKVDSYLTNNIFYEFYSNYELKTQGAMEKTECDFLAYYYSQKDVLYILNPKEFKKYIHKYQKWLTPKFIPNTTYQAMGYAIPITDLGKNIIVAKYENIRNRY